MVIVQDCCKTDQEQQIPAEPTKTTEEYCSNVEQLGVHDEVLAPVGEITKKTTMKNSDERSPPSSEVTGREKLKRHRNEVAGRVWIPELWGHEDLLKDWIDCSTFDTTLFPNGIMSARAALVEEGRRANNSLFPNRMMTARAALAEEGRRASSGGLRIQNRC